MSDTTTPPREHSLDELIACATREAKLRVRVYPGFIERGKITRDTAADELSRMNAIVRLLRHLKESGTIADSGAPISGSVAQ